MKKLLIIITTDFVSYGGLTTVMMNYYRNINKKGLRIDFASTNSANKILLEEIKKNGGEYYNLGERKKTPLKYLYNLFQLLKREKYEVIHVNGNSATMVLELFIACFCKIPIRIAHGHTTRSNYPIIHKCLSPFFKKTYTDAIATSKATGDWLYGSNYIVLNNAIDVRHYQYSKYTREKLREQMGLTDKFVVGNVGKLNEPKNHRFLIKIFKEIYKKREDAILVIAGGGELEEQLKKQCRESDLENEVIFLGMMNDVSEILQIFDVFVFTSIFEGLGMALIEAQAAGLECVSSDTVPIESKVSEHVHYLSLNKEPTYWAKKILEYSVYDRESYSKEAEKTIQKSGYDIKYEAVALERLYRRRGKK